MNLVKYQDEKISKLENALENQLIELEVLRDLLSELFDKVDPTPLKHEEDKTLALFSALQKLKYTHNLLFMILENLNIYIENGNELINKGTPRTKTVVSL